MYEGERGCVCSNIKQPAPLRSIGRSMEAGIGGGRPREKEETGAHTLMYPHPHTYPDILTYIHIHTRTMLNETAYTYPYTHAHPRAHNVDRRNTRTTQTYHGGQDWRNLGNFVEDFR